MHRYLTFFTLFACILTCVCLSLGFWQIQRLDQKKQYLALVEARFHNSTPISMDQALQNPEQALYQKIKVSGFWQEDRSLFFRSSSYKKENGLTETGLGYITPYDVILKNAHRYRFLVHRGWVPLSWQAKLDQSKAAETKKAYDQKNVIQKKTSILAMIRPFPKDNWTLPKSQPEKHFYVSLDESVRKNLFSDQSDVMHAPFMLHLLPDTKTLESSIKGNIPIPLPPILEISNNHLQYALTWFTLGILILGLGFLKVRGRSV